MTRLPEARIGGQMPALKELHRYRLNLTFHCPTHGRLYKNETELGRDLVRRCLIDSQAVRVDKTWIPK